MQQHDFIGGLDALAHLEQHELAAHGIIAPDDTGAWVDFTRDRIRWATHANPLRAERLWELISSKVPAGTGGDEAFDALHDISQLAREFGWDGAMGLWTWLKLQLLSPARRRGIYMASKVRHASTWKAMRAEGLPIISTWIDEAGEGETSDFRDLWRRCLTEAASAEVLVIYRLPGETLKGAFIELGAALITGVPVYAVGLPPKGSTKGLSDEFTFGDAPGITHFPNLDAAIDAARNLVAVAA